ncbi:DUF4406 domain-containing protein [Cedecea colo]|uniref:DUF4406 domain-containing protein n=1 Tax=Cedecea colo TaxID=2552946 RepID=A0ABX0VJT3_9ENTR|nr:DUF4406 domain-containing protein [Cedecea colo]NIY47298.1 DUF4406 domain-containing protein [Cedecea colo]
MKIYIAGPMSGLPDFNRAAFNEAAYIKACYGHVVLNPAVLPGGLEQHEYMDICLAMLRCADSIIMLYRESVYDENSHAARFAEIIVTKNRFGSLGTVYQRFVNGHFMDCDQGEAREKCTFKPQADQKQRKYTRGADV